MRAATVWPALAPDGSACDEMAFVFDRSRRSRVLVLPPPFDEHNKLRRQLALVMQRLDGAGIDAIMPDLPGLNESLFPADQVTLASLRQAAETARQHFNANHCLSVRLAANYAPTDLPGWRYAPATGASVLRTMMRAQSLSDKEAERERTLAELEVLGTTDGVVLGGWPIGAELFTALNSAALPSAPRQMTVEQAMLTGPPPWRRAEPGEDAAQADTLAAIIATGLADVGVPAA
ncbi:MAG: hypothetical protein WA954_03125 [Parerythrobacter sp.]